MLVAHVHDGSRFASVRLLAEDALKIFLNFGRNSTNRTLLTWTVLSVAHTFAFHEIDDLGYLDWSCWVNIRFKT